MKLFLPFFLFLLFVFSPAAVAQVQITPSSVGVSAPGQVPGTATNDNANTGNVGEYISSNVASPGVSLTTNVAANITSISLTAGDWSVTGVVCHVPDATTVETSEISWISTTSATLPTAPNAGAYSREALNNTGITVCFPVGTMRQSISGTTTVYLSTRSSFTVSTNTAFGFIAATRTR